MSFVTQEDVFAAMEPVIRGTFAAFAGDKPVTEVFPRIPYAERMLRYGSDKPDLRNPLVIADVTEDFSREDVTFNAFKSVIKAGGVVRAIPAPGAAAQPRSFFDKLNDWARSEGAAGLGYWCSTRRAGSSSAKGPIAKFIPADVQAAIAEKAGVQGRGRGVLRGGRRGAGVVACRQGARAHRRRTRADRQGPVRLLLDHRFPAIRVERGREEDRLLAQPVLGAEHGARGLHGARPRRPDAVLAIKALQYDLVCNGYELASGQHPQPPPGPDGQGLRDRGYGEAEVLERFGGMYRAFRYGAPPHGGMAAGIDRIVMLLVGAQNLREVTMFPMNQRAEDLLLGAPSQVTPKQLRELHIRLNLPEA
jgi:aspartyl-tRNA synthetase